MAILLAGSALLSGCGLFKPTDDRSPSEFRSGATVTRTQALASTSHSPSPTPLPPPTNTNPPIASDTPTARSPTADTTTAATTAAPTPDRYLSPAEARSRFEEFLPAYRNPQIKDLWLLPNVVPDGWKEWCGLSVLTDTLRLTYVADIELDPAAPDLGDEEPSEFMQYFRDRRPGLMLAIDARSGVSLGRAGSVLDCRDWFDKVKIDPVPTLSADSALPTATNWQPQPSRTPSRTPQPSPPPQTQPLDPGHIPEHLRPALDFYPLMPGTSWVSRKSCENNDSSLAEVITTTVDSAALSQAGTLIVTLRDEHKALQAPFEPESFGCSNPVDRVSRRWILTDGHHLYEANSPGDVSALVHRIDIEGLDPSAEPCRKGDVWAELFLKIPSSPGHWYSGCGLQGIYPGEAWSQVSEVSTGSRIGHLDNCVLLEWSFSSGSEFAWWCAGVGPVRSMWSRGGGMHGSTYTELIAFHPP